MTVYVTGDIHGSAAEVRDRIAQIERPTSQDIIVVVGDAGLEYGTNIQGAAKKEMKKFPGLWLILRGNHDTRYWRDHAHTNIHTNSVEPIGSWHFETRFGENTLVQDKYPNIHYTKDEGGLYRVDGWNCLFIPGAYSVDKNHRLINHLPYEYEEQLSYTEAAELLELTKAKASKIDYVFAHTFPRRLEYRLKYLFLDFIDQGQVNKSTEQWLDVIMEELVEQERFKHFFAGHFHDDKELEENYTLLYHKVVKMEDYDVK